MSQSREWTGTDTAADAPKSRKLVASEKRESFLWLRERYIEAEKLVSSDAAPSRSDARGHANLEWILGERRNVNRDPLALEAKTIELAALWLQDLAVEVDRRPFQQLVGGVPESGPSSPQAGETAAQDLRDATARFLIAFRDSLVNPTERPASLLVDGGSPR
jgi:hypothetical protein